MSGLKVVCGNLRYNNLTNFPQHVNQWMLNML